MADQPEQAESPAEPSPERVDPERERDRRRLQEEREQQARRQGFRAAGSGLELAAAVLGMSLFGWWLGGHYGHARAGLLIGAAIGFTGGLYNLIKSVTGRGDG